MLKLSTPHFIPPQLSYEMIKNALNSERFEEIVKVGRYFLRFDPQVSAEVHKRRILLARLPLVLECEDARVQEAFKNIQKHGWHSFLYNATEALFYGCAYFIKGYAKGGLNYQPISAQYLNYDAKYEMRVFVYSEGQQVFLEERSDVLKVGNMDIYNSVCYRVLSIAALKFLAMQKYMTYLENLSIPPLVLKSEGFEDDKELEKLLDNLEDLRASSVGIFNKEDTLELLNGNVDRGVFLDFLRYCDECISKVVSAQVLSSNAVSKGTQALGVVHENMTRYMLEFDAKILIEGLQEALKEALGLYFENVPSFELTLDTNTEIDEERQARVYKALYEMGLEVDLGALQKAFNVPLRRAERPVNVSAEHNMQNSPVNLSTIEEDLLKQLALIYERW
ncbi:phage portal protein family protein [Helicobacter cynogastricus]|uniref:phage portal protein family protein n=1 Tax=Helicobacter cynogastricus TaxID=329937 RepID=UPI001F35F9CD|nr:DUF935 family protein [Helicobacter cynogastricus]